MKSHLMPALAATLAALATSIAGAQSFGPLPPSSEQPVAAAEASATGSIASASRTDGPNGDVADRIVKEINADPSMAGTKIAVTPDEASITLTGAVKTRAQSKKAAELAAGIAGETKIVNAIRDEEI